MPKLAEALGFTGNPFEHYVAELEPNISEYAVKPPYFEVIDSRTMNRSTFILFGDRGAGKSATRLTIFKEVWKSKAKGEKVPLAVNLVDFSEVVVGRNLRDLSEENLVKVVAFVVIESLLTWLSSLEEDEREVYLRAQNEEEKAICYGLLRDFYLNRPESRRERSAHDAMALFNQAFRAKSQMWATQKWDRISSLIGTIAEILVKRSGSDAAVSSPVSNALRRDALEFDSILVLRRLVMLVKIFDFNGIAVLIDKVDETDATNNSVDRTAELIYPLLARVQLMEVADFAWVFFLWSQTKHVFEGEAFPVRLDKLGHATVSWDDGFFHSMLDRRVNFYSGGKHNLMSLFQDSTDEAKILDLLVRVSMRSPRELIRLLDVIIREHDVVYGSERQPVLLDWESMQAGVDKYVTDTISTVYGERLLAQIFRLKRLLFTNKDVQSTFRVGAQSARTRIQSWESAGIIKHVGTRAAEGALGGKPANEYAIADARIERVMARQLIKYEDPLVGEPDFEEEGVGYTAQ